MHAVADDSPKYLRDLWLVEVDNFPLGVFETVELAQRFIAETGDSSYHLVTKIPYYINLKDYHIA